MQWKEAERGGGGNPPETIFKDQLKEIKDQNKKVHKKHEGGCLWFNIYYYDPDYL